ncbi:MAG: hypothetical protein A2156_10100 [Deltaproteobacteria bacterium RBG_16_48_10]|nr:MAG: hypothetical protein A2156_10100 [Deltaproteobacteria bacterium RBG_16_48_10]
MGVIEGGLRIAEYGIRTEKQRGFIFIHDDIRLMSFVIPDLVWNPVFFWIPAGVYPDENRGGNDAGDNISEFRIWKEERWFPLMT